jgi:hypothetical protein
MAVDWLRSCYTTVCNFGPGYEAVPIQWYFVDEAAPWIPGETVFRSIQWTDRETDDLSGLGEVWPAARPWAAGNEPWQAVPCTYMGPADWWVNGVPAGTPPRPPRVPQLVMKLGLRAGERYFAVGWRRWAMQLTAKLKEAAASAAAAGLRASFMADVSARFASAVVYQFLARVAAKAGLKEDAQALANLSTVYRFKAGEKEDAQAVAGLALHLEALLKDQDSLSAKAGVLAGFSSKAGLSQAQKAAGALSVMLAAKELLADALKLAQGGGGPEADKGKVSVSFAFSQFQTVTPSGGCGSLPATLTARLSGFSGGSCVANGKSFTMTYGGGMMTWTGTVNVSGPMSTTFLLKCVGGHWQISGSGSPSFGAVNMSGTSGPSPNLTATITFPSPCNSGTVAITRT